MDLSVSQRQVRNNFVGDHIQHQLTRARDIKETKADLLDEPQKSLVQQWLVQRYPAAELHAMTAISAGLVLAELLRALVRELTAKATHPYFTSYRFRGAQRRTKDHLMTWLNNLPAYVQRVKGFVCLLDDPRPHLLNCTPGMCGKQ